ncbi:MULTISPECIES: tyrosine-type recombinase/integrase [Pseudomonas]|uniref:tyrosine-type recombinase/integrase n=1 Tax=Pseudomonas TaxID=286 RepID=UPI000863757B|nr:MULTISPECIES: integrase arm-type DNA-binding domain-containing protein [Pseudomonas]MDD1989923.1 integrase arm-type DNA-binding domain-containing protein [Pseudomonas putida]RFQ03412.1 DUF4102 domain-containing protein [Pseudomonas putida]HDS1796990.1 integrase arm-type DNA-binding domain-containing protein [Pseudomonas putida]
MATDTQIDRLISKAKPDPQRKIRIPCGGGLAAVINKGGTKKFVSRLRPHGSMTAVDFVHEPPYPALTLKKARDAHQELRKKIKAGIDPRQELLEVAIRNSSEKKFGEVAEDYFNEKKTEGGLKPSTLNDYKNRYKRWIEPAFGKLRVTKIDSLACVHLLNEIRKSSGNDTHNKGDGKRTASICRTVLKMIFTHAASIGCINLLDIPTNGLTDTFLKVKQEHVNDERRFLELHELCSIWQMLDRHKEQGFLFPVTVVALQIAILTGMRRQEVVGMQWSELEAMPDGNAVYHVPKERMKRGRVHKVFLSKFAMDLINILPRKSDRVFQSTRGGDEYADKTITKNTLNNGILSILGKRKTARPSSLVLSIEPFAPHDLRRSFSSGLKKHFNVPNEMIHAMIAHGSDDKDDKKHDKVLDIIYIKSDESDQMHKYWRAWSDLVELNLRSDER